MTNAGAHTAITLPAGEDAPGAHAAIIVIRPRKDVSVYAYEFHKIGRETLITNQYSVFL